MASTKQPRRIKGKYIVALILTSGVIIAALIGLIGKLQIVVFLTPTPTPIPFKPTFQATTSSSPTPVSTPTTLPSATAVVISPTTAWIVSPTDYKFGAVVTNHEFNKQLNPGQILSLSTDVGQFTALDANNNPMTVQLDAHAGKSYVIILMGDQTGTAPITLDVTGVSSGNIDWEKRTPPAGTPWVPAALAVEERVASGLKMSPNCGNGCTTVGYYILDSGMHIVKSEL